MSEAYPVLEEFYPILIENYIRFETAVRLIRSKEAGSGEAVVAKFKIAPEYYNRIINNEISAPLIGLNLSYDEASSILMVEPTPYFLNLYENKIMCDVALKQSEDCKVRYSKFIEPVD